MSVTHVHDWHFKPDGDIAEGIAAIEEYVDYLKNNEAGLELSLWLRDKEDELHYFHVAVFDSQESLDKASRSEGTRKFTARLYPEIDHSTYTYPTCDVIVSSGGNLAYFNP